MQPKQCENRQNTNASLTRVQIFSQILRLQMIKYISLLNYIRSPIRKNMKNRRYCPIGQSTINIAKKIMMTMRSRIRKFTYKQCHIILRNFLKALICFLSQSLSTFCIFMNKSQINRMKNKIFRGRRSSQLNLQKEGKDKRRIASTRQYARMMNLTILHANDLKFIASRKALSLPLFYCSYFSMYQLSDFQFVQRAESQNYLLFIKQYQTQYHLNKNLVIKYQAQIIILANSEKDKEKRKKAEIQVFITIYQVLQLQFITMLSYCILFLSSPSSILKLAIYSLNSKMNSQPFSFPKNQMKNSSMDASSLFSDCKSKCQNQNAFQSRNTSNDDNPIPSKSFRVHKEVLPIQTSIKDEHNTIAMKQKTPKQPLYLKHGNYKSHIPVIISPSSEKQHSFQQFQECLLHNKTADLICLDHQQMICPSCALFGTHKGHNIESQENFLKKLSILAQSSQFYYDKLRDKGQTEFSKHIFQGFCKQKAILKRNQMSEQIKRRFQEIIKNIKLKQKECLQAVQDTYKNHLNSFKSIQLFNQRFRNDIQDWTKYIETIRQVTQRKCKITGQNLRSCIKLLNQGCSIIKTGEDLYNRSLKQQAETKKVVEDEVTRTNLVFLEGFQQSAKHCCCIIHTNITEKCTSSEENTDGVNKLCSQQSFNIHFQYLDQNTSDKLNSQQTDQQGTCKQEEEEFLLPIDAYVEPFRAMTLRQPDLMDSSINQFVSEEFRSLNTSKDSIRKCFNHLSSKQRIAKQSKQDKQNIGYSQTYRKSLFTRKKTVDQLSNQQYQLNDSKRFSLNLHTPKPLANIGPLQQRSNAPLQRNILRDKLNEYQNRSKSRNTRNPSVSSSCSNLSQSSKKKSILKVSQKHKKVIDDLQNDRTQVIDLSGAGLEHNIMLNICQYVKRSKKLKVLKLIRNNISDESFVSILRACGGSSVISLNLSQNQLSEKCLSGLEGVELGNLRSLTLSMNKINRRIVKPIIDDYEKKGVTLTV